MAIAHRQTEGLDFLDGKTVFKHSVEEGVLIIEWTDGQVTAFGATDFGLYIEHETFEPITLQ